jgi:hypothetical protein
MGYSPFYLNMASDFRLSSERLDLVPANHELADVEWHDHQRLAELLNARIPEQWPPDLVPDSGSPNGEGWWDWYVVKRENDQRVLIGTAGLKGWPQLNKSIQLWAVASFRNFTNTVTVRRPWRNSPHGRWSSPMWIG